MANLFQAVRKNDLDRVRFLVNNGANILEKHECGHTVLHEAAIIGCLEIIKFLIECGSDVSEKDMCGMTALHWASCLDYLEIAKLLIESGSNIKAVDNYGKTVINLAMTKKIKEFLIEQLEIQQNGGYLLK